MRLMHGPGNASTTLICHVQPAPGDSRVQNVPLVLIVLHVLHVQHVLCVLLVLQDEEYDLEAYDSEEEEQLRRPRALPGNMTHGRMGHSQQAAGGRRAAHDSRGLAAAYAGTKATGRAVLDALLSGAPP